ncbi:MAG: hypothetical protein KatS3mg059_0154 [Thermomicrobiales bacterium]|nr:MAG: hypothetical protein KatS3mg059_0154 [Thermomicrobiales bacterium]
MSQQRYSRPATVRPVGPRGTLRRRLTRLNRAQLAFAMLALLTVCSLLAAAVGTVVVDELTNPRDNDTITLDQSQTDEVEAEFRRAVEANPTDASAAAALANYLANTGRLTEAIGWYERALRLDPGNMEIRLDFARALAEGDKRKDAELQFQKVLAAQPENAQAHYDLAELYRHWVPPRIDDAVAEYRLTMQTGPDTLVAELAAKALQELGYATPGPGTPTPIPEATP